jgi:Family of unknown function (DUF6310)
MEGRGRCVVREASQPWPVLVERCFQSLDHDRVRFNDRTGKCAVASTGAAALGLGLCVLAAPEIVVGAVIVVGVVVVGVAINECADKFPPNRYPGMDVLVDGVSFDALQVGVHVLWEIKTHQFDTYTDFIRRREIEQELDQIEKEKDAAAACGYGYVIGVSTQAHKDALLRADRFLNVVVTGCKR